MSASSREGVSSNVCDHKYIVEDLHEGTIVCVDCCLVIEEQLFMPSYEHTTHISCQQNKGQSSIECASESLLRNVCDRLHIPKNVLDDSIEQYTTLKSYFKEKKTFKADDIAAFALYDTLSRHSASRSMGEIESHTNVLHGAIWAIESALCSTTTVVNVCDLIDSHCKSLEIPFYYTSIMKNIVENIKGLGATHPRCLSALVIYLYCKEINIKLTMKQVCIVCQVSSPTIHKIIRRLKREQHIQKISVFYIQQ